MTRRTCFVLSATFAALTASATAQIPLLKATFVSGLHPRVVAVPDVDGDQVPDVMITLPEGRIDFVSGRDGRPIRTLIAGLDRPQSRPLADRNGDGIVDVLIHEFTHEDAQGTRVGRLLVVSGADGSTLLEYEGDSAPNPVEVGFLADTVGDVNGDGVDDFVTSAIDRTRQRALARVISGSNGNLLYNTFLEPTSPIGPAVRALAVLGDIDQDGTEDFAITYQQRSIASVIDTGTVVLYSGATGQELRRLRGQVSGDGFGTDLLGLGDQNGDGIPDYLLADGSNSFVLSGLDDSLIVQPTSGHGVTRPFFSLERYWARVGDLDGDGVDEYARTATDQPPFQTRFQEIEIYRGGSGQLFQRVQPDGQRFANGPGSTLSIPFIDSSRADFDGDGIDDLLYSDLSTSDGWRVGIYAFGQPVPPSLFPRGISCRDPAGGFPAIAARRGTTPGSVNLELLQGRPGQPAVLAIGLTVPLADRFPFSSCGLYINPRALAIAFPSRTDATGAARLPLPIASVPGLQLTAQWAVSAPGANPAGLLTSSSMIVVY